MKRILNEQYEMISGLKVSQKSWGWDCKSVSLLFSPFLPTWLKKKTLTVRYDIHIWQVWPLLCHGDTCQMWLWSKGSKTYFWISRHFIHFNDFHFYSNFLYMMRLPCLPDSVLHITCIPLGLQFCSSLFLIAIKPSIALPNLCVKMLLSKSDNE